MVWKTVEHMRVLYSEWKMYILCLTRLGSALHCSSGVQRGLMSGNGSLGGQERWQISKRKEFCESWISLGCTPGLFWNAPERQVMWCSATLAVLRSKRRGAEASATDWRRVAQSGRGGKNRLSCTSAVSVRNCYRNFLLDLNFLWFWWILVNTVESGAALWRHIGVGFFCGMDPQALPHWLLPPSPFHCLQICKLYSTNRAALSVIDPSACVSFSQAPRIVQLWQWRWNSYVKPPQYLSFHWNVCL